MLTYIYIKGKNPQKETPSFEEGEKPYSVLPFQVLLFGLYQIRTGDLGLAFYILMVHYQVNHQGKPLAASGEFDGIFSVWEGYICGKRIGVRDKVGARTGLHVYR
jgi:hypothetical protein